MLHQGNLREDILVGVVEEAIQMVYLGLGCVGDDTGVEDMEHSQYYHRMRVSDDADSEVQAWGYFVGMLDQ